MNTTPDSNEFPVLIRKGNTVVRIYRIENRGGRITYQVADYSSGKRRLKTFTDLAEARRQAGFVATKMQAGEVDALRISPADRASYSRAVEALRPTGAALEIAATVYAEAVKILGGDRIIEAAKDYSKRHPANLPRRTVGEVAEELLAAKVAAGASHRYVQDLRYRFKALSEAFNCQVTVLRGDQLQDWIDGQKLSQQSRKNFATVLGLFVKFAIRRGYLPKGFDELGRMEKVRVRRTNPIEVFTPEEIAKLLASAPSRYLPALAIGAFAGLRTSEVEQLDWSNVHLAERFIEISAKMAKTASRRIVPVSDNLAAWLAPYATQTGPVWNGGKTTIIDAHAAAADLAGVPWKRNGLRHSYASYRFSETKNPSLVASELGNSAAVVFQHYRELVRPGTAAAWFGVFPTAPPNVVSLSATANGVR